MNKNNFIYLRSKEGVFLKVIDEMPITLRCKEDVMQEVWVELLNNKRLNREWRNKRELLAYAWQVTKWSLSPRGNVARRLELYGKVECIDFGNGEGSVKLGRYYEQDSTEHICG